MINKFYILAGFTIGVGVYSAIAKIRTDTKLKKLKAEVDSMKKERIDDWVDTASDILEGQQDSIDRLEDMTAELDNYAKARLAFEQNTVLDIYRLEGEIAEIKEILEKTAGVKFTSGEEE